MSKRAKRIPKKRKILGARHDASWEVAMAKNPKLSGQLVQWNDVKFFVGGEPIEGPTTVPFAVTDDDD